jgi:hypothetical protein
MIRIRNACINRTDCSALRLIKMTLALNAFVEVDDVYRISFRNCLNWTFGLAQTASSTFIIDLVCHIASLFTAGIIAIYDGVVKTMPQAATLESETTVVVRDKVPDR